MPRAPIEKQVHFGGRKRQANRRNTVRAQMLGVKRREQLPRRSRDPHGRRGKYSLELPEGYAVVRLLDGSYMGVQYDPRDGRITEDLLWESPVTDDRYQARQWAWERWEEVTGKEAPGCA